MERQRIEELNSKPVKPGKYVLYWMQAAQRAEYNHALEYSIYLANELKVGVVVVFGITANYPEANLRHYHFMLEGLRDTENALAKRGIKLVVRIQSPELAAVELSKNACRVVVDAGHTHIQRKWRNHAARNIDCILEQVETNLIVPVTEASDKENFSAGTLRPRINRQLDKYLVQLKHLKPEFKSLDIEFDGTDISDIESVLSKLDIDKTVRPVENFRGGTSQAKEELRYFIKNKLDDYDRLRNNPCLEATSNMSPYLHFGQISPLYIALKVLESKSGGKDAYLEQLIIRRELAFNFVYYNRNYDTIKSLPPWATATLNVHKRDKRQYVYKLEEFENAQTDDPYWNAAQKEMVITGKMHGFMRMYWGKKILEWSRTPKRGFEIALYLNNKYELDGRDPNGFAGVAWCFGKHDRAWAERDVFGKIRYMNENGLKRKFDAQAYIDKIDKLEKSAI